MIHTPRYSEAVEVGKFWSRVDRSNPTECWPWTAGASADRGMMQWRGRKTLAYRISWELEHGSPPPSHLHVCHHCDNPRCVRPAHLFLGDDLANVRDALSKGRAVAPPVSAGEAHPRARHSDQFVRHAREQVARNGLASLNAIAHQLGLPRGTLDSWVTGKTRVTAGGPLVGAR